MNAFVIMDIQKSKTKRSTLFVTVQTVIGVMFFLLFVAVRIVFGNWMLWRFWIESTERSDLVKQKGEVMWWLYLIAGIIANCLNFYWFLTNLLPRALALLPIKNLKKFQISKSPTTAESKENETPKKRPTRESVRHRNSSSQNNKHK
jgi:magnesium-transporting ATPase (P-type)